MTRFAVRPARKSDNDALVELDRKCTMGEQTTLAFDRAPDFFARSKPYEQHTIVVAESDGAIVGVGGLALKLIRVGGELLKAAYYYDLRVDPALRRVGVASAIGDALREVARESRADVTYSLVLEGNVPSLQLAAKRGARPVRRCVVAILTPMAAPPAGRLRRLEARDLDRVSVLVEWSYARHDLFPPRDGSGLRRLLKRTPALTLRSWYGLERDGDLTACFGLWDYSSIMRMRVHQRPAPPAVRPPWPFEAGEIAPHFLLPLAFRTPALLAESVQQARRLLHDRQQGSIVRALLIPYDPQDPAFVALGDIERFEIGIQLFARPIRKDITLGERPFYVDPIDL
jgi:GNAT superfamily N-acetyltransferase